MKNLWILPDKNQNGLALTVAESYIAPLNELTDLSKLPQVLNLGMPEEIVRAKPDISKILYAQFVKLENGKSVFSITAPAGTDLNGRIVFITNLQFLELNETPTLPPVKPINLPDDVKDWSKQFDDVSSESFENIREMLDAVQKRPYASSFASERLAKAKFTPDWMPKKKLKAQAQLVIFFALFLSLSCIIFIFNQ